ncbi:hypothetical protein SNEBB_009197, partial [Seison nebaliae]
MVIIHGNLINSLLLLLIIKYSYDNFYPSKPISRIDKNFINSFKSKRNQKTSKPFDKLVIIVIDALAERFVYSTNYGKLPYIWNLVNNGFIHPVILEADNPTVTKPRIKSLISGAIPNYKDVILNFYSSTIEFETIFDVWKQSKKSSNFHFFGDDTWTSLFSDDLFNISESTNSLYISDFTEVDTNVTRNLIKEFENKMNFPDILILHYLGLDHIGHSITPNKQNVEWKLREMDETIFFTISRLMEKCLMNENERTVLIITGDHGMAKEGGHGGSSMEEIRTVTLFVSITRERAKEFFKIFPNKLIELKLKGKSYKLSKKNNNNHNSIIFNTSYETYRQVDLVPTICSLFHLSFPTQNIGIMIPEVLHYFYEKSSRFDRYELFQPNFYQLIASSINREKWLRELKKTENRNNIDQIYRLTKMVRNELNGNNKNNLIPFFIIYFPIILLLFVTFNFSSYGILIVTFLTIISKFLLNDFIYNLLIMFLDLMLTIIFNDHLSKFKLISFIRMTVDKFHSKSFHFFLFVDCSLLPLMYFSSSFIEEEHLIWNFVVITVIIFGNIRMSSLKFILLGFCFFVNRQIWGKGDKWTHLQHLNQVIDEFYMKKNFIQPFLINITFAIFVSCIQFSRNKSFIWNGLITSIGVITRNPFVETKKLNNLIKFAIGGQLINIIRIIWNRSDDTKLSDNENDSNFVRRLLFQMTLLAFLLGKFPSGNIWFLTFYLIHSLLLEDYECEFHLLLFISEYFTFQQGLKNNIGSIDFASGYVGMDHYNVFVQLPLILFFNGIS